MTGLDKTALEACPFCGGEAEVTPWHGGGPLKVMISCSNSEYGDEDGGCSAGPQLTGETPEQAIAAWNRRALPAVTEEQVEAARVASDDMEEALRLAEIGEYLYNNCAYSYGDGQTEPREYGIEWQWQQSKPGDFGQGMLLAEAARWHREQAEEGHATEATKLRAALEAALRQPEDAVEVAWRYRPKGSKYWSFVASPWPEDWGDNYDREPLYASPAPAAAGEPEVKALEWLDGPTAPGGQATAFADTVFGRYVCRASGWMLVGKSLWKDISGFEASKAGALADFETRHSALVATSHAKAESGR